jgi:phosphoglycolate phosphatase
MLGLTQSSRPPTGFAALGRLGAAHFAAREIITKKMDTWGNMNTVIFDLDGTITDPAEGITRSINHALVELGYAARPERDLEKYIGPQLRIIFSELMGTTNETRLARAIELYRERYIPIGYRENRLYDGIHKVLSRLIAGGSSLYIATAKRKDIAVKVLEYLNVGTFFAQVHGCDLHRPKSDLLGDILLDDALATQPTVMIGDRDTDFRAAAAVGMPSIGVRWGYGTDAELAMATYVVETPSELPEAIERTAQPTNAFASDIAAPEVVSLRASDSNREDSSG